MLWCRGESSFEGAGNADSIDNGSSAVTGLGSASGEVATGLVGFTVVVTAGVLARDGEGDLEAAGESDGDV